MALHTPLSKLDLSSALINSENADETKRLIESGVDVNTRNIHGDTALMRAKTAEQTKLLLKAGANVNDTDIYGRIALMFAKSEEQTRLLVEANAKANADTVTSFKHAKFFGSTASIRSAMLRSDTSIFLCD